MYQFQYEQAVKLASAALRIRLSEQTCIGKRDRAIIEHVFNTTEALSHITIYVVNISRRINT